LIQFVLLTENRQALLFEPAAEHAIEYGSIDHAAFDGLSLNGLIAEHLRLDIFPLLIQAKMLQPEQHSHTI
jgi:hypothetical protein